MNPALPGIPDVPPENNLGEVTMKKKTKVKAGLAMLLPAVQKVRD